MTHYTRILCSCRFLSAFKVCTWGEGRAYSKSPIEDMDRNVRKSKLFPALPRRLADYERWLPGFKLTIGLQFPVYVLLRPKPTASTRSLSEWRKNWQNLPRVWWTTVFIPAVKTLPPCTRTRKYNTIGTFDITGILPKYLRLYPEDVSAIDRALQHPTRELTDFSWYLMAWGYGQRRLLKEGEPLSPEAFGLGEMFHLPSLHKVSVHIALNFSATDRGGYSLFWGMEDTHNWTRSEFFITPYVTIFEKTWHMGSAHNTPSLLYLRSKKVNVQILSHPCQKTFLLTLTVIYGG